jgi:hypothetical protein
MWSSILGTDTLLDVIREQSIDKTYLLGHDAV